MKTIEYICELYSEVGETTATPTEIIDTISNKTSCDFLGRGANRAVFINDEYVFKVPISSTGKRQNTESYNVYNSLTSSGDGYLVAPVEELNEGILKQKFCAVTHDQSDIQEMKSKLAEHDYEYLDWDDSSVGVHDGNLVIIDIAGLQA